jgi:hypothetical protein
MEMPEGKEYLIRIRGWLKPEQIITVPNTEYYRKILLELNDKYIQLKK